LALREKSVTDGEGRPDAGVPLLYEGDGQLVLILDLLLQYLVAGETGAAGQDPGDPRLSQRGRAHHPGQVSDDTPANPSSHLKTDN